ncbi:hypothetical protein OG788_42370 [Streptomyces sp. NBC_00647]|uniref:hypothetical protein n=1 Tax=Streptomyces sp. NBC_00647 TaxID=2975796 RepID=UPI00324DCE6E
MRAGWLLACLLIIGSTLFGTWPPTPVGDGPYHYQPVIYALDPLLSLVDLGQERAYSPSGAMQWVAIVFVGTGRLPATTVAAGAGRVLRRT